MVTKKKSENKRQINSEQEIKPKNKGGRPTLYNEELASKICNIIASSNKGLKKICDEHPEFPEYITICHWLWKGEHPFLKLYARAKEQQADYLADELVEIADQCLPAKFYADKARLQVDARKWVASKLKAKKYGDRIVQEHTGANDGAIKIEQAQPDLSGLTAEELQMFKMLTEKISANKNDEPK